MGLMKRRGNLIIKERIMILAGISVGGAESITPKQANAKHPRIKAPINTTGAMSVRPIASPITTGIMATIKPKASDAHISPKSSVVKVMGEATRRSSVRAIVSQGKTAGPIELAVNKRTMPSRPEKRKDGSESIYLRV